MSASSSSVVAPVPASLLTQTNDGLSSIDSVVQQITSSTDPTTLIQQLNNSAPKDVRDNVLSSILSSRQDPLDVLDPAQHTLGYLYILTARLHSTIAPKPSLEVVERFCSQFDPVQARMAPDRVTVLAKDIVRVTQEASNVSAALDPLYKLVTRYPPSLSYLTTIHPLFLTACCTTQHYATALPVLQVPITNIDLSISDLTYNDNLIYHYAGGIAFGALKRWREAEEFFEICASAPAQVPAAIQLEASKKLVLTQLIIHGKTSPPPKYTNPNLQRLLKASPYGLFIREYPQKRARLNELVNKNRELYTNEKNIGLIQQTVDRAPRWLIKKLTATYLTLGLSDIAKEVGIESDDEVREIIISMIESNEISASISADGTVTFSDPVPQIDRSDVDKILKQAQEQTQTLLDIERALNVSRDYLNKAVKHKDDAGWGQDEDLYNPSSGHSGWVEEFS